MRVSHAIPVALLLALYCANSLIAQDGVAIGCGRQDYDCQISVWTKDVQQYQPPAARGDKVSIGMLVNAFLNRSSSYGDKKEYRKAIADLGEALRWQANDETTQGFVYYNRGRYEYLMGAYDDAARDLRKAVDLYRQPSRINSNKTRLYWAYLTLGDAEVQNRQFAAAIPDLDNALALDPNSALAYGSRAHAHYGLPQEYAAIKDFDQAIRLDPKEPDYYVGRARAESAVKKWADAVKDYKKVIELDPNQPSYKNSLAWLLATSPDVFVRNGSEAIKYATAAADAQKWQNPNTIDTLAAACAEAGKFDDAVKWQLKALSDPKFAESEKDAARGRLKLYQNKQPYHESP